MCHILPCKRWSWLIKVYKLSSELVVFIIKVISY